MAGNILDGIEALAALEQCRTVSEAAAAHVVREGIVRAARRYFEA